MDTLNPTQIFPRQCPTIAAPIHLAAPTSSLRSPTNDNPGFAPSLAELPLRHVQQQHPFEIQAIVLLPDHFHTLWTLPEIDQNLSLRMRLIKRVVSKYYGDELESVTEPSFSRTKRKERNIWQRRFWEHLIRDEADFVTHYDYIHYNPVKHGLCETPQQWPFSSFYRLVREGIYPLVGLVRHAAR